MDAQGVEKKAAGGFKSDNQLVEPKKDKNKESLVSSQSQRSVPKKNVDYSNYFDKDKAEAAKRSIESVERERSAK